MSSSLFYLETDAIRSAILLTALCFIWPFIQIVVICIFYFKHPAVEEKGFKQDISDVETTFDTLMECILLETESQHYEELFTEWLLVEKANVNNYNDKKNATSEEEGDVKVKNLKINTKDWVIKFLKEHLTDEDDYTDIKDYVKKENAKKILGSLKKKSSQVKRTPMMDVIQHHINIAVFVSRIEQINLGLTMSKKTKLREERLPFRRVVETIQTINEYPRFPSVLNYSVVRAMKDKKDWSRHDGTPLNPIILSVQPWLQLKESANSYLRSAALDIALFWIKIWFPLVVLGIVFK